MRPTIRWVGLAAFQTKMARMPSDMKHEVHEAMRDIVNDLEAKSVAIAPYEHGDLRGSADNSVTTRGGTITGRVYYGAKYALRQHEEYPSKRTPGTQWKYLEKPAKDNEREYIKALNDALRKAAS